MVEPTTNSTLARLLVGIFALLTLLGGGLSAQSIAVAVTNVTIIDATGAAPCPTMTVIVNAGRITTIGRTGSVRVPQDATWSMVLESS